MQSAQSIKLEYLMESLLIAFVYNEPEHRFTLVSDYPERSPGSVYDLVGLVFQRVNRFHRELGNLAELRKYKLSYATKDAPGSTVFQHIETGECDDGCQHVNFWFGPNFGGIAFDYRRLEVHRRGTRVVKVKDRKIYFDAVSMKEFDWYNPFPELLK